MRHIAKILGLACVIAGIGLPSANAAFFGMPRILKMDVERIAFQGPALPPIAHTRFCLVYPDECRVRRMAFRRPGIKLTEERWKDLIEVNAEVNGEIKPASHGNDVLGLKWTLHPASGDCKDYAATKRHELLARGWPSRALLLAEAITSWGEHHLVLVVRTMQGDFVLDNLRRDIRPWTKAPYQWVKIQSPSDPRYWSTLRLPSSAPRYAAL